VQDVRVEIAVAEPKPPWRERTSSGKLLAAKIVTAVLLVALGAIIQLLLLGWLSGSRAGTVLLALWVAYLAVGVVTLVRLRGRPPQQRDMWSITVLSRTVRGCDGQRSLVLQILAWLAVGHLMCTAVIVYAVIEAIGSLGF
jgi:hypothetical protein